MPLGFDNRSIEAPFCNKPHIVLREGWWRVSPKPREPWVMAERWDKAYSFIGTLNLRMRAPETFEAESDL